MRRTKFIFIVFVIFCALISCKEKRQKNELSNIKEKGYMMPRVLIITTGTNDGNGVMAQGVIIAAQTFNKNGAFTSMDSRDILLNPDALSEYNILLLPTAAGYHDADRKYSLTYMSDEELITIKNWVNKGGMLIAGDNIGRNMMDATDRTSMNGSLTKENWALAECFGISLAEKELEGFRLDGNITKNLKGNFVPEFKNNIWALVVDSIYSENIKTLAYWTNNNEKFPALIQNRYGKGICFLLPTYYLLHPANSGGYLGAKQIQEFFNYTLDLFYEINNSTLQLNIWPDANDFAFCVTFNAEGNYEQYKRVFKFLDKENITPTIFVDQQPDTDIRGLLKERSIQSNDFLPINNQDERYYEINKNIVLNEIFWDKKFTGFRFPFTRTSYWGFECLSKHGYRFDSSIGVDNINDFYGCAFPYNIAISDNSLYKYIDMLEISPVLNDDYYFCKNILTGDYSPANIEKNTQLYQKYLENFWDYAIKPYNGLMVYLGHPRYIGYNDTTLVPLKKLIKKVKNDNTWLTTIESVSEYWNKLEKIRFYVNESQTSAEIILQSPDSVAIENVSVKTKRKPVSAKAIIGKCDIVRRNNDIYIVFDAYNGQKITLKFDSE